MKIEPLLGQIISLNMHMYMDLVLDFYLGHLADVSKVPTLVLFKCIRATSLSHCQMNAGRERGSKVREETLQKCYQRKASECELTYLIGKTFWACMTASHSRFECVWQQMGLR